MSTVEKRERWGLFEWDSDKGETNEGKHGIRFEDACEVFNDPFHALEDFSDRGEERVGVIVSPLQYIRSTTLCGRQRPRRESLAHNIREGGDQTGETTL
jgi:uncharacterized DUF497 family protein